MTHSAAPAPSTFSPGLPVEVGEIERQLGLLWENSDAGKVRASLVNLVIYSEAPDAIETNTPLLSEIAANHAFRALLVQAAPAAADSSVQAWITAHCHLRDAGKKEICSEQITFRLRGTAAGRLPNIVFSHLDSDLPLCLWWQGNLHAEREAQLWNWVDRLIVDSNTWTNPAAQFAHLRAIAELSRDRCATCDLNWTRLFNLRYATAQLFDLAPARERLHCFRSIKFDHAPGCRLTALQLVGWLASRLGWTPHGDHQYPGFRSATGENISIELVQTSDTAAVSEVAFDLDGARASIRRDTSGEFYCAEFSSQKHENTVMMLPAGREKDSDTLLAELGRTSRHPLYWPAVRAIEPLLQ